jgi:hypothetical protein
MSPSRRRTSRRLFPTSRPSSTSRRLLPTSRPSSTPAAPPADRPNPAGPYGSAVGRLFQPFALTACNRSGADATWRFDGPDFFTSNVTVVAIAAAWSVPDQRQAAMLQTQIVDYYAGRGVRFVQVLVQNSDMSPATAAACNAWVSRYGLSFPELIDPAFVTRPFAAAFPAYVIVDRCGRIVRREYGSDVGLSGMRAAIDDALDSSPSP